MPKRNHRNHQSKGPKMSKEERVKSQIKRMIEKTDNIRSRRQEEANILTIQQNQLQDLLEKADKLDATSLKDELKNIARAGKSKSKEIKNQRKDQARAMKGHQKKAKWARKEEKRKFKNERKREREQRKKEKDSKKAKIESARLQKLPSSKDEIGASNDLYIHIDGYNIIGNDAICRKAMRKRGSGKARSRLSQLLQTKFLDEIKCGNLALDYNVTVTVHFDGNGRNCKYGDIEVIFSTKQQIVDDKLVEMFSNNEQSANSNVLVVTSDRELTFRLDQIGVKVMKSSTFYKAYLKEEEQEKDKAQNDQTMQFLQNDEEEKENEPGSVTDDIDEVDEDLAKLFAAKMNTKSDESDDAPELDDEDGQDGEHYTFDDIYDEVMQDDANKMEDQ